MTRVLQSNDFDCSSPDFQRNEYHKADYTAFIGKTIQNRYAEKGTIKMKMPEKMERFGFFHTMESTALRSLVRSLLYSSVMQNTKVNLTINILTYKLVGVLSKFSQRNFTFTADIEAIFLEVYV